MRGGSKWEGCSYIDRCLAYPFFYVYLGYALVTCEGVISPCVSEGRVSLHERGTWVDGDSRWKGKGWGRFGG